MDTKIKVEPVNHYGLNLHSRHGMMIATAPQLEGLLLLDQVLDHTPESTEYIDIDNDSCLLALEPTGHACRHHAEKLMFWHRQSAHVSLKDFEILPTITHAPRMTGKCDCVRCIKCKLTRKPLTTRTSHATEPLQLVYCDISGPLETAIGGSRETLLFIEKATRHTDEYILKWKSKGVWKLKELKAVREKELGEQLKRFRTDGGGQYTLKKYTEFLNSEAIVNKMTTPFSPLLNGVVEQVILTIMKCVPYMLDDSGLSRKNWAFAVLVGFYLKNRIPTRSVVGKTQYKAWHGSRQKPSWKHHCVFRCLAFMHVPKENRKKLDYRATPGIFVGYSILTK